jgi:hypothetical protein
VLPATSNPISKHWSVFETIDDAAFSAVPAGQSDGTGQSVHVLLPSTQKAPAGHSDNDELSVQ